MAEDKASDAGEEQRDFNVVLQDVGESKVAVIKLVRRFTGLGLRAAEALVEPTPVCVFEGGRKEQVEELMMQLIDAGATVTLDTFIWGPSGDRIRELDLEGGSTKKNRGV